MNTADYTPEAICQAIGLPGFERDPALATPGVAMRILLKPSFHPEVCITLTEEYGKSCAAVVAAQRMVWHLFTPGPVLTDRDQCTLDEEVFRLLSQQFDDLASSLPGTGIIIDGMPVDTILLRKGAHVQQVSYNVGASDRYSAFVARTIEAVWNGLKDPACKNSLASAAGYAGAKLPLVPTPERKPAIRTVVLGSSEDRVELLEALRKQSERPGG